MKLKGIDGDPHEKSLVYLPRQYLPQPYGGICDEGLSGKGGDFEATWQDVLEGCTALLEELR